MRITNSRRKHTGVGCCGKVFSENGKSDNTHEDPHTGETIQV